MGAKDAAEVTDYISKMCSGLVDRNNYEANDWEVAIVPYLVAIGLSDADAKTISGSYRAKSAAEYNAKALEEAEEEDEGEDLCNCTFSLAYGAKILLNGTKMNLKRGKVYGIVGTNGVGKSTLMRAIDNGQVDGFPPKSELRTVFVEPDISADQEAMDVVSFCEQDPALVELGITRETIIEKLYALGFVANDTLGPAPIDGLVTRLSGGWRMRLALARAQMKDADILLMDGPTNHMDVTNVAWLVDYISNLKNTAKKVTVMQVSDDTGYLDKTCTNIINFETNRKLKFYIGNLSAFVAKRPECKSYFELKADKQKFGFPRGCQGQVQGHRQDEQHGLQVPWCHQIPAVRGDCPGLALQPCRVHRREWCRQVDLDQGAHGGDGGDRGHGVEAPESASGLRRTARVPPH